MFAGSNIGVNLSGCMETRTKSCLTPRIVFPSLRQAYGKNLEYIFTAGLAGLAEGGKLIWSSTTPISSNCTGCGDGTTMEHVVD